MFKCDKCGLCCSNVGSYPLYSDLDRGDGKCRHFDDKTNLCTIYENRPIKCNVDKFYELYYSEKMSKEEFYNLNYEACKKLKSK